MGILDTAGSLIDQGVAGAKKGTRSIALKSQISDIVKRRETYCAQFGAALYEEMRDNQEFRATHEAYFASIEGFDSQIAALKEELSYLENPPQGAPVAPPQGAPVAPPQGAVAPVDQSYPAPVQPVPVAVPDAPAPAAIPVVSDAIVASAPVEAAPVAEAAGKLCASCGLQNPVESMFCGGCGAKL